MNFKTLSTLKKTPLQNISATDIYADESRCVLPIEEVNANESIILNKKKYIYRVLDETSSGVFPTIDISLLQEVYDNANPCYFQFEIEWTTSSAIASYPSSYEFLNYPEIQIDGNKWTYFISCRIAIETNEILLNCWRMKELTN